MKTKLIKNTAVYTFAGMIPFIVSFLMLPIYTRFMSPDDYGVLGLLNSLSAFLLVFMGLQLANSLFRFYFEYDLAGVKRYFSTVVYTSILTNVVFITLFHIFGKGILHLMFPEAEITYIPYILLIMITAFFTSLSICASLLLKVQEKARAVLIAALVHVILGVGLNLFFVVHKGMGAVGVLTSSAINSLCHAAFLCWMVRSYFVAKFDFSMLKSAFSFSVPLIANALSGVLFIHTDKWVLGYSVPIAQIGLYNIAQRISAFMQVTVKSFKDSYTPSFMSDSVKDKALAGEKYGRMITKWAVGISILALGLALFSEELIKLMTPPNYHAAYRFVPPLVAAYIFGGLYFFCSNIFLFEKKTAAIPLITFAAGAFNIGSNIILIPLFGALTAAYTTLVAYALTFVLALLFSRRHYRLDFDWMALAQIFGAALAVFLVIHHVKGASIFWDIVLKCAGMLALTTFLFVLNYAGTREDACSALKMIGRNLKRRVKKNND